MSGWVSINIGEFYWVGNLKVGSVRRPKFFIFSSLSTNPDRFICSLLRFPPPPLNWSWTPHRGGPRIFRDGGGGDAIYLCHRENWHRGARGGRWCREKIWEWRGGAPWICQWNICTCRFYNVFKYLYTSLELRKYTPTGDNYACHQRYIDISTNMSQLWWMFSLWQLFYTQGGSCMSNIFLCFRGSLHIYII